MTTSQSYGPLQDPRYIFHILWIYLFVIWFSVSHSVSRYDACICFLAGLAELNVVYCAELNVVYCALIQSPQQNELRNIGILIPGIFLVLGSTDKKMKTVGAATRKIWGWEYSHLQKRH